jgi:glycosyltransferase involved in cell wall biosynthesis
MLGLEAARVFNSLKKKAMMATGNQGREAPAGEVTVIISCYNNWETVRKCLWALEVQDDQGFRVILADDGSGEDFAQRVAAYADEVAFPLDHIRHDDRGFRKAAILNKAVAAARTPYLLFIDGDIVIRSDWVGAHRRLARGGRFMAGGSHVNIPAGLHGRLERADIQEQRLFDVGWLAAAGMADVRKYRRRLGSRDWKALLYDFLTPRPDSFVGCNSGCWRVDFERVGGFDESFSYGGVDRDLGIRMANAGIRGVRHRYSLACVHLDHQRPYRDPERMCLQKRLLKQRRKSGQTRPDHSVEADQAGD